ncbi:MAG: Alpha/beta hydrolase family protein [Mucilaginibacter sp.]|nr:Alpha/beta hydrolase family protein [Mucilaginibacter sp.]
METKILIIPGLGDSGEKHWQTYWLKKFDNSLKVYQDNWDQPNLEEWIDRLNDTILKLNYRTILVAHSLAVSLVIHWAQKHDSPNIIGALLVAPADVDSPSHTPEVVRGFSPMPKLRLPFPSIVVASDNDTFVSLNRAGEFARFWGSHFKNIGSKGHINSDSNLEFWEEGQDFLKSLMLTTNHQHDG